MKVYLDDEEVFEITQRDLTLLAHSLLDVKDEIKRRLKWVITHKCEQVFLEFDKEWTEKLRNDSSVASLPKLKEDFISVVIARPDYLDCNARKAIRDAEEAKL